jgi:hypothetical protein
MFAYQKTPFPLSRIYKENPKVFHDIDSRVKITDIAAFASVVLG